MIGIYEPVSLLTGWCMCMCRLFTVFQQEYGSLLGSERAASSGLFPSQTTQPAGTLNSPPTPQYSNRVSWSAEVTPFTQSSLTTQLNLCKTPKLHPSHSLITSPFLSSSHPSSNLCLMEKNWQVFFKSV